AGAVTVAGSLTTIRPGDTACFASSAELAAVRGEFESFQIAIRAGETPIRNLDVVAGALEGPSKASIGADAVTVYREGFYQAQIASDGEGGVGPWPDALIPRVDPLFHERRNAFPVAVAAHDVAAAWVDVLVPPSTAPGRYTGRVTVSSDGATIDIPIALSVSSASIPATSSLASAFATDFRGVCDAHARDPECRGDEDERWMLHALYAQAAL